MAEIGLQRSRVMPGIGKGVAAGVAQHVRMDLELEAGLDACALDHLREARGAEGCATLADEDELRLGRLALQSPQGPQLDAGQGMRRRRALLHAADMQARAGEVDLVPSQVHQLGRPQAVAEGDEDGGGVAVAMAVAASRLHQPLDLRLGQVFAGPQFGIRAPERRDCPIYGSWRDDLEAWFCHEKCPFAVTSVGTLRLLRTVSKPNAEVRYRGTGAGRKGRTGRSPKGSPDA